MLHEETIDLSTKTLLIKLQSIPELSDTRLVGGTALALLFGHRTSVDLDLFGDFDINQPLEILIANCGTKVSQTGANRFMKCFDIDGVKVDLLKYPFPWIRPMIVEDGIRIASVEDIAALKINAIINRGTKKDFIDIYRLLQDYPLDLILNFYKQKYTTNDFQTALRSLTFFDDAEDEVMPKMLINCDWQTVKDFITNSVKSFC